MAKRLLTWDPEFGSLGNKICMVISFVAGIAFACVVHAKAHTVDMNEIMYQIYSSPCVQSLRKGDSLFRDATPKKQEGPTVNNPWAPEFRSNRYMAHHVWYEKCACWLNIAIARAKELSGRDIIVYYDAKSVFRIHFRNPKEATAALNILLQGENIELPPYYVTKEVV